MKKEKIIKMLSSAFDEIGRLRVENRRLLNERDAEVPEAVTRERTYTDVLHGWLAERIRGER